MKLVQTLHEFRALSNVLHPACSSGTANTRAACRRVREADRRSAATAAPAVRASGPDSYRAASASAAADRAASPGDPAAAASGLPPELRYRHVWKRDRNH